MEDLYDPEEKILCPYNSSHNIRRCRMSFHLVKCAKSHGEQKMVACDFNATHVVPQPELRYHHQTCPDRKRIEPQIVEGHFRSESRFPIPKFDYETEESWDNENVPTYDPKKNTEDRDILRQLDVESAAKRKTFRQNERMRLRGLNQAETSAPPPQEPKTLPPHRNITDVKEDVHFNPEAFKEKLKISDKVFLQYKKGTNTPKSN